MDLLSADADPETMAREDPLATQVWKMYARQKATLPHAQRMENLTWRMMALALKKKKEDESREKARELGGFGFGGADARRGSGEPGLAQSGGEKAAEGPAGSAGGAEMAERGRTIDKGKARVQVVGFDGANQDTSDENECVAIVSFVCFSPPATPAELTGRVPSSEQGGAHGLARHQQVSLKSAHGLEA